MNIVEILSKELGLKPQHVENTLNLIKEGNTIPFIARYRKEQTGQMSDTVLRNLDERLRYLENLKERKEDVYRIIEEQGKMTEEISLAIEKATTLQEVEDIYAPYKQKRRTRATIAKEKGLEGLAEFLKEQTGKDPSQEAKLYLGIENGAETIEEALEGAMDIIAEEIAEDAELRKKLRLIANREAMLTSTAKTTEDSVYSLYYEYSEKVSKMPPHRILAVNRGEKEDILKVKIEFPEEKMVDEGKKSYIKNSFESANLVGLALEDGYKRLLLPSLEREIRATSTERAEERAIGVFGQNLKNLLLQPPVAGKTVLAWDPAYRTGCKIAVIDKTGKLLDFTTVYPTKPENEVEKTKVEILKLIEKYDVNLISIGNGTASRESEQIVSEILKEAKSKVDYLIVNEAGASVYSASELGEEEHPDINVSIRGAISIGRRVQDPLAELVKIDPKHIGVGQYQHDVNQKRLEEVLKGVVEDSVNAVGVDLNTASWALLQYVSGISKTVAKNIVSYRDEEGLFKSRTELKKVKRLGPAAFQQCAGFLRIREGKNPLDNTSVHPESYDIAMGLLKELEINIKELGESKMKEIDEKISSIGIKSLCEKLEVGEPTLKDIIEELKKPGRDPRDSGSAPVLRSDILKLEDLKIDMELEGTVRNVVDFGAFVDIGLKNDGLVHISELSNNYVSNPMDVVAVGQIVKVKVIKIDETRGKVSLSMKNL